MNYRHAFHAGNFADVVKHIVLVRVIEHLKLKEKPFRFIDTHAGTGLYDISGDEARRSGEWRQGIGAILADDELAPAGVAPGSGIAELLAPFFAVLRSVNGAGAVWSDGEARAIGGDRQLRYYPGAGEIARRLLRPQDRLVLNELHQEDAHALRRLMGRDDRVRTLEIDGWAAVKSLLPPKERRGVMLIDPPFEIAGEFKRLEDALTDATERFATGTTILWFPIKAGGSAGGFVARMQKSGHRRLLLAELLVCHRDAVKGLNGCGLIIHNPPFGLDQQLAEVLAWLGPRLAQHAGAATEVRWLTGE